jgi:hypothetical protein
MSKKTYNEREQAIIDLRRYLRPGTTVYTVLRHVSASGMSRTLDLYVIKKNKPLRLTYSAAKALGYSTDKNGDLKVSGCGMDMGWNTVYNLSRTMFPKGYVPAKAGQGGRNGEDANKIDTDGGYALVQRWL